MNTFEGAAPPIFTRRATFDQEGNVSITDKMRWVANSRLTETLRLGDKGSLNEEREKRKKDGAAATRERERRGQDIHTYVRRFWIHRLWVP